MTSEAIKKLQATSDAEIARCLDEMRVPKELVGMVSLGDLMREGATRLKRPVQSTEAQQAYMPYLQEFATAIGVKIEGKSYADLKADVVRELDNPSE